MTESVCGARPTTTISAAMLLIVVVRDCTAEHVLEEYYADMFTYVRVNKCVRSDFD